MMLLAWAPMAGNSDNKGEGRVGHKDREVWEGFVDGSTIYNTKIQRWAYNSQITPPLFLALQDAICKYIHSANERPHHDIPFDELWVTWQEIRDSHTLFNGVLIKPN